MIWEELNEKLIAINLDAQDSDDLFEKLGQKFVDNGFCKTSYISALKAREKSFPTGLQLTNIGVAIPHTETEHVNQQSIGIAILNKPVDFIQMGSIDEVVHVKIIFMLAIKEANTHIENLSRLISLMQDSDFITSIIKSKTPEEIIQVIKIKDQSFVE